MDVTTNRIAAPETGGARTWSMALLMLLWLAMMLLGGGALERSILVEWHVADGPLLQPTLFITRLGDWEVLLALPFFTAAWLLWRGRYRLAAFLLGWVIVGRLLVGLQKLAFGRIRPEDFEYVVRVAGNSFPSGHSANSMIVYMLLAAVLVRRPEARRLAFAGAVLLSLLIGLSRVLLGVHWPSDVLGGWAFGLIWVLFGLHLCRRFELDSR